MTLDSMLAALQGLYEVPLEEDTSTVRGLLRYCRGWLRGDVTAEQLHNPCWEMSSRLRNAAEATFRDLDQNPNLCDEVREPILATGEGYEAIVSILEELPILAAENKRQKFGEVLEEFEAERLAVLDAAEEIEAQMSGRICRCPRCGQSEDKDRCQECGLTMLYPDPKQLQDYSYKSGQLSPIHVRVHSALVSVKQGKASLEILLAALPPLLAHFRDLKKFCEHSTETGLPQWVLPSLRDNLATAQKGVERIQSVAVSQRISDLNRGWEDIFESSVAIRADLTQSAKAMGKLETAPSSPLDGYSA